MPHPQAVRPVAEVANEALIAGILEAGKMLWPYFLVLFALTVITAYLKGKIRRAGRDNKAGARHPRTRR